MKWETLKNGQLLWKKKWSVFDVADRLKSAISGEERRAIKKHKKIFRKKCSEDERRVEHPGDEVTDEV